MPTVAATKNCAAHRAAQKKYVAKNPAAQRKRAADNYRKNAAKIKSQKKAARKASPDKGKAGGGGNKTKGRPKSC